MHLSHVLRKLDLNELQNSERTRYINRIGKIAKAIESRFPNVRRPEQIKLKHAQYIRNTWLPDYTASKRTQQEYIRALGLLVRALGRSPNWQGALGMKKKAHVGGRPTKVGVRLTKRSCPDQRVT